MGNELHYVCLVATRRLLVLIGVLFGLIWLVQYFELAHVDVLSSVFVTTTSQVVAIDTLPSMDPLSSPTDSRNLTRSSRNSTRFNAANGLPSAMKASDAMDSGRESSDALGDDFSLENGKVLKDTTDDAIDLGVEFPLMESLEMERDSAIEAAVRNEVGESGETSQASVGDERNKDRNTSTRTANIQLSTYVDSSASKMAPEPRRFKGRSGAGMPISEMNELLRKSRVSYHSVKPRWASQADEELLNAKKLIESADSVGNSHSVDADAYRNFSAFTRSYESMEQTLKIFIYNEGERPIFHQPELNGIYASEGWFMKQLEQNKRFVTKNANKAHLFYLPFGSHILRMTLHVPGSHSRNNMVRHLSSYLQNITTKHRFWNRNNGTDHFLVACHDWVHYIHPQSLCYKCAQLVHDWLTALQVESFSLLPQAPAVTGVIMNNCIRALCNTNVGKGFQFSKDVSLPVTYIRNATNPLKTLGGKPPSQRHILAFFAGRMHGYLRPILLHYWENKDPDMKIFGKLQKSEGQMTYSQYMRSSKYCISARGYEPFTPRVVEAISYECVPVILSDNYIPPFFETLNWESFAVFILEKEVPNLKSILASIPEKRYIEMQRRVRQVQKHFLWHAKPLKFDVFHMILHSIWYTRVLQVGA